MGLDTFTQIHTVKAVQGPSGPVPAASDAEVNSFASGVDISSGGSTSTTPPLPGRARSLRIIADFAAAGHVAVHALDSSGNVVVTRDNGDSSQYGVSSGGGQVFVSVDVFGPILRVDFVDDSGGSNSVSYFVRGV